LSLSRHRHSKPCCGQDSRSVQARNPPPWRRVAVTKTKLRHALTTRQNHYDTTIHKGPHVYVIPFGYVFSDNMPTLGTRVPLGSPPRLGKELHIDGNPYMYIYIYMIVCIGDDESYMQTSMLVWFISANFNMFCC
jgi:hypothetical protein